MGHETLEERGFAFAPANFRPLADVVPMNSSARARFANTSLRPAIYVLSDSAPDLDRRLHSLFGLYARIRSFASIGSLGAALGSAERRKEQIAMIVLGDSAKRRALPRFLEFVSTRSRQNQVDTIFCGKKESMVFHGRELVDVWSGLPEHLDRRFVSVVREAIENFYCGAAVAA